MNIFVYIAILASTLSITFIIISLYQKPFMEATGPFIILSGLVLLNSIFFIATLTRSSMQAALRWAYFQELTTLIFPLLFFNFMNFFLGNRLSKTRLIYKLIFLIIPLGIFIYLVANRSIEVRKYYFGYISYYSEQVLIGVFYLVPIYLLINTAISYRIYRNQREKKSNGTNILMLAVFLVFLLMNVAYRPLTMSGVMEVAPISVILNLFLFLFITIALLNSRFNIQNLAFKRIFENVGDCIMVTDYEGKITQLNRCLFERMFSRKDIIYSVDRDKIIKEHLLSFSRNKKDFKFFLKTLESKSFNDFRKDLHFEVDGSEKIFDVIIYPIYDSRGKLAGKSTIFRDVTESRFYEKELRNQSLIDYLTGAYNTRYIFERLKEEIKRYDRYKEPFCAAYGYR